MLIEQLRKEWRVREAAGIFDYTPRFGPEGLVLGAGTVLAKIDGEPDAGGGRLEALLAVAYGRLAARSATGHVKAAIGRWRAGDLGKAKLHLALARLKTPKAPCETSRRLFMAEGLMRAGFAPATILDALEPRSDVALKYRDDELRVPKGSGRPSGRWTASGDGASTDEARSSAPEADAPSSPSLELPRAMSAADAAVDAGAAIAMPSNLGVLGGTTEETIDALGFISRIATGAAAADLTGPFVALGVLFWPSHGPEARWVDVGGPPADIKYYWSPDESTMRIAYRDSIGDTHVKIGTLGPGNEFRDPEGDPIGRLIKGLGVAVSLRALEDIARDDEPDLCPQAVPDKKGAKDSDQDYEDWVKKIINPDNPTPRGMGYSLLNPLTKTGTVMFDDCQHSTGMMVEAKGNFDGLILRLGQHSSFEGSDRFVTQAQNQIGAAGSRPILWAFKDLSAEIYVRDLFSKDELIKERIHTVHIPMEISKRAVLQLYN